MQLFGHYQEQDGGQGTIGYGATETNKIQSLSMRNSLSGEEDNAKNQFHIRQREGKLTGEIQGSSLNFILIFKIFSLKEASSNYISFRLHRT